MLCKATFPIEFQAEEQTSLASQILELLKVVNYRQSLPTSFGPNFLLLPSTPVLRNGAISLPSSSFHRKASAILFKRCSIWKGRWWRQWALLAPTSPFCRAVTYKSSFQSLLFSFCLLLASFFQLADKILTPWALLFNTHKHTHARTDMNTWCTHAHTCTHRHEHMHTRTTVDADLHFRACFLFWPGPQTQLMLILLSISLLLAAFKISSLPPPSFCFWIKLQKYCPQVSFWGHF